MNKKQNILLLLPLEFAALVSIPFLIPHTGIISLISFVPLLFLDKASEELKLRHTFLYFFGAFLIFNAVTTFWIWFASPVGGVSAIILNALQMAAVFELYRWSRRVLQRSKFGGKHPEAVRIISSIFLIVTWAAWEHFYFDSEISWPWLVLGNAFATNPELIQWYELTGTVGGSVWILLCSLTVFSAMSGKSGRMAVVAATCILLPAICSVIRYSNYHEEENPVEVVVAQPNIDPYQKYNIAPQKEFDRILTDLFEERITDSTEFLVTPETFTFGIDIDNPDKTNSTWSSYRHYREYLTKHPDVQMILGAQCYRMYEAGFAPTSTARHIQGRQWYDLYNAAILMDCDSILDYNFKSKLVPAVEFIPYSNILKPLAPVFELLGGSCSSYGVQSEMDVLSGKGKHEIGVAICYESIYGDYSRVAALKGADLLAVITNDGWWRDTPGYRQHFNYAALLAIETRRSVVHAANTGISGIINQRGDVIKATDWWTEDSFNAKPNANTCLTPFTRYGDLTGKVAAGLFFLILAVTIGLYVSDKISSRGKSDGDKS